MAEDLEQLAGALAGVHDVAGELVKATTPGTVPERGAMLELLLRALHALAALRVELDGGHGRDPPAH